MTLYRHHCSTADINYISANDSQDYPSFSRNVAIRASTGTLKQPRLPGSEKFRFSQNYETSHEVPTVMSNTLPSRKNCRIRSCNDSMLSPSKFSSSKRKPILPISKNTSRVLNNTNVELSADTVELATHETNNLTKICKQYLENGDEWSRSSSDQSLERHEHSQPDSYYYQNNPDICITAATKHEMNNNQPKFATIHNNRLHARSNRFCSTSTSPTQSIISSDDDVWVLRTDHSH